MRGKLLFVLAVSLIALTASGFAQPPETEIAGPFESVVPAYLTSDGAGVDFSSESIEQCSADESLPTPVSAAPPPAPDSPHWGQFLTPSIPPMVKPPIQYNLIGPPRGVVQQSDRQEYQSVLSDPDSLLAGDTHIGQSIDLFRPDGMAPIGVFGDHTLPAGSTFLSYRYLQNSFDQNYAGSHRIGVPASYPSAPTRMMQNSQIALIEYGATQDFTILAYLPFQHNEITSRTATGNSLASFTNPGDIRIMGLLVLSRGEGSQSHLNLGLNFPVGFLEATASNGVLQRKIPYQLRTSSGTYDLLLGYTYRKQYDDWTWGAQANAVLPTGLNTLGYELGNQFQLTSWVSRRWTDRWSSSARLDGRVIQNIRGFDARIQPLTAISPVYSTTTQASQSVNALLGVNYLLTRPGHRIREQRVFLEAGTPVFQRVDGPQLGLSWTLNAGWGMTF